MEKEIPETQVPETPQTPTVSAKPLSLPIVALVVLVALVVGGVGGYFLGKYQDRDTKRQVNNKLQESRLPTETKKEQDNTSGTDAEEQEVETDPTKGWKVYRNTNGYSFKYPDNILSVTEQGMGAGNVGSAKFISVKKRASAMDAEQLKIDIASEKGRYRYSSIKELAENILAEHIDYKPPDGGVSPATVVYPVTKTNFKGSVAYTFTINSSVMFTTVEQSAVKRGNIAFLVTQNGGNTYLIAYHNKDIFNQILSTFEFID